MKRFVPQLLALVLIALPHQVAWAQFAGPKAGLEVKKADLGRIRTDRKTEHSFMISNSGSEALEIGEVRLKGQGLKAKLPKKILPGETRPIMLSLEPVNLIGDWDWEVSFETNDPDNPIVTYGVTAFVYPPIEVAPAPRVFFSLYDDESAVRRLEIINHKVRPLEITRIESLGSHFLAELETLEPGKRFQLAVTVPESIDPGRFQEALLLHSDDPEHAKIRIAVNVLVKEDLSAFPERIDFGSLSMEKLQAQPAVIALLTQTLLVRSRKEDFTITAVDSDHPFLTISRNPDDRAKVIQIDVGVDLENLTPGPIGGVLTIATDHPRHPRIEIPLSGIVRK
jgi:hypothetical protein